MPDTTITLDPGANKKLLEVLKEAKDLAIKQKCTVKINGGPTVTPDSDINAIFEQYLKENPAAKVFYHGQPGIMNS